MRGLGGAAELVESPEEDEPAIIELVEAGRPNTFDLCVIDPGTKNARRIRGVHVAFADTRKQAFSVYREVDRRTIHVRPVKPEGSEKAHILVAEWVLSFIDADPIDCEAPGVRIHNTQIGLVVEQSGEPLEVSAMLGEAGYELVITGHRREYRETASDKHEQHCSKQHNSQRPGRADGYAYSVKRWGASCDDKQENTPYQEAENQGQNVGAYHPLWTSAPLPDEVCCCEKQKNGGDVEHKPEPDPYRVAPVLHH
jgi:hypothetical protein